MPLSEDEQRILQDIERSFYETDPKFVESVSNNSLYRHASRNCKLAAVGFLVSLVVLLAFFTRFPVVGFIGFVGMLVCAAVFVQNIKRVSSAGFKDIAESDKARQVGQTFGGFRERFRNSFRKDS